MIQLVEINVRLLTLIGKPKLDRLLSHHCKFLFYYRPGVTVCKPGSATFPFFGIDLVLIDGLTGEILKDTDKAVTGLLAVKNSFPSIARTIYNDHERYIKTYFEAYKGYYLTGDGATRDSEGYYWINGRVDDVINISGHRLSTSEIESALVMHEKCNEAAVVGIDDEVTGQALVCFCVVTEANLETSLKSEVRKHIGPFASPKMIILVSDLPKTRSGKIMRRILRKIAAGEVTEEDFHNGECGIKVREKLGDVSTLADPSVVFGIVKDFGKSKK
jgi:acetyl-CoA synthetase